MAQHVGSSASTNQRIISDKSLNPSKHQFTHLKIVIMIMVIPITQGCYSQVLFTWNFCQITFSSDIYSGNASFCCYISMCSFPPLNIFISSELTEKDALYHKLMCSWYISSCGENRSDGQGGRLLQVSLTVWHCIAFFVEMGVVFLLGNCVLFD